MYKKVIKRDGKIQFYKDKRGKWRWRVKARNGRILGDSGQGYASRRGAIEGLELLRWEVAEFNRYDEGSYE